jgi:hypothetical protein
MWGILILKNEWKVCSKLVEFSNFPNILSYESFDRFWLWYEKL